MDARSECPIEVLDNNPVVLPEEEVNASTMANEISLYAFSGTYNPRTISVTGWVGGKPLMILVDSGSTHNFIQDTLMHKLGLAVEPLPEFWVFIGSWELIPCMQRSLPTSNSIFA